MNQTTDPVGRRRQDHCSRSGARARQGTFLLLCPTMRDDRELARLASGPRTIIRHEYASLELEAIAGVGALAGTGANPATLRSPLDEVDQILKMVGGRPVAGVISTDDYPGSTLACILAQRLGLPAPSAAVNLLCQHKYQARVAQAALAPEAVPRFASVDVLTDAPPPSAMPFPFFVKPVKSFFSIGAHRVDSIDALNAARARWRSRKEFFRPFEQLLERYTPYALGTDLLLAEDILTGVQATLEGYADGNEIHILGIVDSVMYPGTIAFERFEYPSSLPETVQERISMTARRLMRGIGFSNGMFNIEFIYDPGSGRVGIIEINPRMASQFADLYEKVDGYNSYEVLLDLASGRRPVPQWRRGSHEFAASCVLRTFGDMFVEAVPSPATVAAVEAQHPGCRIDIFARAGHWLSEEMQDDESYRYGVINLGGGGRADVLNALQQCVDRLGIRLADRAS